MSRTDKWEHRTDYITYDLKRSVKVERKRVREALKQTLKEKDYNS